VWNFYLLEQGFPNFFSSRRTYRFSIFSRRPTRNMCTMTTIWGSRRYIQCGNFNWNKIPNFYFLYKIPKRVDFFSLPTFGRITARTNYVSVILTKLFTKAVIQFYDLWKNWNKQLHRFAFFLCGTNEGRSLVIFI
jgi:hypothetical protein